MTTAPASVGRTARRRDRTRQAIIAAAQDLIAEQGGNVTARDVADRADVALKTVYNHFASKQDMVESAVLAAATEFEDYLEERTAAIDDPVVVAATRMRLHGRMIDSHPRLARVLVNAPAIPALLENAMSTHAAELLVQLGQQMTLSSSNYRMLLLVVFAANSRLTAARIDDPSLGPESADELALWLMTALGADADAARRVVDLPLP